MPKTARLINRAQVKAFALACAQERARKFTRVSGEFYDNIEASVRSAVRHRVATAPSVGVTLR